MNILLTSVGRRAYMVKYFQEALHGDGEVHVCNSDDMSVAFQYADKTVISPLIYDDNYIPFLLKYCKSKRIKMLISLFDIDLLVLAKNKEKFSEIGVTVVVSDSSFIEVCNDKWKSYEFLKEKGFFVPRTFLNKTELKLAVEKGMIQYPVVVKPRFGCGSIALSVAHDETELDSYCYIVENEINSSYLKYESAVTEDKLIYQEMLKGQEYGIDIINDLNANFRNVIVKRKWAMRSGETDISETVDDERIYNVGKKLSSVSGHIGNLDCDVFLCGDDVYVLEMNARLGGGYPFSHIAGCNLPKALVAWANGNDIDESVLQARTGIRAYKELSMVKER